MRLRLAPFVVVTALALLATSLASADVFNMPGGQTSLDFVTVGDPGNTPDNTTGLGSVGYAYSIGQFDVTTAQYTAFLNAVATTSDPYGLYNAGMAGGYAACGISQSGTLGDYTYSTTQNGNYPVNYINWGDAARFCNWLQNGQPTGAEGNGTTETGAYTLSGATSDAALVAVTRNAAAIYCLPTESEWYKAAYYKGGGTSAGYWLYPTRSNTAPSDIAPTEPGVPVLSANSANYNYVASTNLTTVGTYVNSASPYGTFDQGGLLFQWTDTPFTEPWGAGFDLPNSSFESASDELASNNTIYSWSPASTQYEFEGFRVAEVPEPSTLCLLATAVALLSGAFLGRRKMRRI